MPAGNHADAKLCISNGPILSSPATPSQSGVHGVCRNDRLLSVCPACQHAPDMRQCCRPPACRVIAASKPCRCGRCDTGYPDIQCNSRCIAPPDCNPSFIDHSKSKRYSGELDTCASKAHQRTNTNACRTEIYDQIQTPEIAAMIWCVCFWQHQVSPAQRFGNLFSAFLPPDTASRSQGLRRRVRCQRTLFLQGAATALVLGRALRLPLVVDS